MKMKKEQKQKKRTLKVDRSYMLTSNAEVGRPASQIYRVSAIADTIAGEPVDLERFRKQFPFWC